MIQKKKKKKVKNNKKKETSGGFIFKGLSFIRKDNISNVLYHVELKKKETPRGRISFFFKGGGGFVTGYFDKAYGVVQGAIVLSGWTRHGMICTLRKWNLQCLLTQIGAESASR